MSRLESSAESIRLNYEFITVAEDKNGNRFRVFEYSMSIFALNSEVDALRKEFPDFKFWNIYGSMWLVYFDKALDWGERMIPEL